MISNSALPLFLPVDVDGDDSDDDENDDDGDDDTDDEASVRAAAPASITASRCLGAALYSVSKPMGILLWTLHVINAHHLCECHVYLFTVLDFHKHT